MFMSVDVRGDYGVEKGISLIILQTSIRFNSGVYPWRSFSLEPIELHEESLKHEATTKLLTRYVARLIRRSLSYDTDAMLRASTC